MKLLYAFYFTIITIPCIYPIDKANWDSSQYIWNFGIINSCDRGMIYTPRDYFATKPYFDKQAYTNLQAGDIVWVPFHFIDQFCQHILPDLTCPIVLVIADGDETFSSDCSIEDTSLLINHPCIIHIFAQNNGYTGKSEKVSHIPIGIDLHTIAYKGSQGGWGEQGSPHKQEQQLNTILAELKPTHCREKKAFVDFHHADTMHGEYKRYLQFGEDRKTIFQRLLSTNLIDHGPWMRRSHLWQTKGQYAFSVSPHGNGLDCHRTWEDLLLGCIVIVKTSPLDLLYKDLPIVIVNDWSEITSDNMNRWLQQYGDAFSNPSYREKLTLNYWVLKIQETAKPYKECKLSSKVLICGVCKDVEDKLPSSIKIMETISHLFEDSHILVYENNSLDNTPQILSNWQKANQQVTIISEYIEPDILKTFFVNQSQEGSDFRPEAIARARNIVLDIALSEEYEAYDCIIWIDMDFTHEPNYEGFKEVFESSKEWDAVFAYGIDPHQLYWDWYALRDELTPIGSELLGNYWWFLPKTLSLDETDEWYPVYSAFGGCGIYKKDAIKKCRYSALVTSDLSQLYQKIIKTQSSNQIIQHYLNERDHLDGYIDILHPCASLSDITNSNIGIITPNTADGIIWRMSSFVYNYPSVCEHVPFHASMIINGHNKLFINPRLIFRY